MKDAGGKIRYTPFIEFKSKDVRSRWSDCGDRGDARDAPGGVRWMDINDVITIAENLAHNCGYACFPAATTRDRHARTGSRTPSPIRSKCGRSGAAIPAR